MYKFYFGGDKMRKKILLLVFVVSLALVLVSCGVIPDISQKEEIKEVINNYWLALSNKQYELAKTYCMPYGNAYYAVEDYQTLSDYDYVTINWTTNINWVGVTGNKATVSTDITLVVTVCLEGICSTQIEKLYNYSMYLIKISGNWKLK